MKPIDVERVVEELHHFLEIHGGDLKTLERALEVIQWLQFRVEVLERDNQQKKYGGSGWINGSCYTADQIRSGNPWV